MNKNLIRAGDRAVLIVAAVCSVALTGCVARVSGRGYTEGPSSASVAMQGDFVYYPDYELYYNSSSRQYRYRDGNSWVTRSEPPHVSARVVLASPSVRMSFHDAPERHHADVVKQYPKGWKPTATKDDKKRDH